jgi:hypothetical protein
MFNFTELLISFETYCGVLAEEEFERSVDGLADKESARIQSRTLFKQYLARCADLAKSDHIRARYAPSLEQLAKHRAKGTSPGKEQLEAAKVDLAIIEFYRHIFGPHVMADLSEGPAYPDWQTALVHAFETPERYLQAIQPVTKAHQNIIRQKGGLDRYVNVLLRVTDAYERARERMFDAGALVGRYKISSEMWEEEAGEYRFRKTVELNRALADPNRRTGFVYLDRQGDLVHSYRLASTIRNSRGQTVTSKGANLSPVLLVPHMFNERLNEPSLVSLIDFGEHQNCRLEMIFLSKSAHWEPSHS